MLLSSLLESLLEAPQPTRRAATKTTKAPILTDATGNEMLAERLCRPFTWEVVSKLPADEFCISRPNVLAWVEDPQRGSSPESPSS